VPGRLGNDHPSIFPYAPFATADGQIMLAIGNDAQFRTLCAVLGLDGVAEDTRFATNLQRSLNREALRPLIVERLAAASADEWFARLTAARLPCAPILDVGAGIAFAERIGLDPVVSVGGARPLRVVRNPITLSRTPVDYLVGPPDLGQDDDDIRRWLAAGDADTDAPAPPATTAEQEPAR
jgi:crotonobetainyl-CoA:carnitine CoA-transferase CaiB-like acyl-CoA transferase